MTSKQGIVLITGSSGRIGAAVMQRLTGRFSDVVGFDRKAPSPPRRAPERVEMTRERQLVGAANGYAYRAEVPAARPATDYTARLIPHHDGVAVPLEDAHILWLR